MVAVSTHIGAAPGDIADTVLLPGDPLRAKWLAESYFEDVTSYSSVRNMLGFTGTYRGQRVSVQGSGMGQPSLAIYVNELLNDYDVRTVVRVGSCGGLRPEVAVRDVIVAMTASTDSSMNRLRFHGLDFAPCADFGLLRRCVEVAEARGVTVRVGGIVAVDSYYSDRPELLMRLADFGVLAVEMETSALYTIAAKYGARALSINTVSDNVVTGVSTNAEERERTFAEMAELALETVAATAG